MATEQESTSTNREPSIENLCNSLTPQQFQAWYRERQYRENIQKGRPYFNGPAAVPEPERHSPSKLLQCHRKVFYQQENAPEEQSDPTGIFWFGRRFEEEIALPFLREAVAGPDEYVTNSIWVDYTIEIESGKIQIRGETDPVIVDSDSSPLLLTEIKTKRSIENVQSPNPHHRAQAHAYMKGLSEKYDRNVSRAVVIYGSRTNLDIRVFTIDFDPRFWRQTVSEWAQTHTTYRLNHELPPAAPEYDWECQFCSYRERCGKGESQTADSGVEGFIRGYDGYPREKVEQYLDESPDEMLTPTLARKFPELASRYGVLKWQCPNCTATVNPEKVEDTTEPLCPSCADCGELSHLSLSTSDSVGSTESASLQNNT